MKDKTRKILGTPKTSFHKRTLAYIEPLLTEINEEDIEGKKLTLEGCWKSCYEKGRKLAKDGCADCGIPVFMKESLAPIVGEENMRREFPWERSV